MAASGRLLAACAVSLSLLHAPGLASNTSAPSARNSSDSSLVVCTAFGAALEMEKATMSYKCGNTSPTPATGMPAGRGLEPPKQAAPSFPSGTIACPQLGKDEAYFAGYNSDMRRYVRAPAPTPRALAWACWRPGKRAGRVCLGVRAQEGRWEREGASLSRAGGRGRGKVPRSRVPAGAIYSNEGVRCSSNAVYKGNAHTCARRRDRRCVRLIAPRRRADVRAGRSALPPCRPATRTRTRTRPGTSLRSRGWTTPRTP